MVGCRDEVLWASSAAGGDEWHLDPSTNGVDHLGVESLSDPVGIHGVQENLPGAELGSSHCPGDGIDTGGGPSSVRRDLEAGGRRDAGGAPTRIHGQDDHLVAETPRHLRQQLGTVDGRGVDTDFVRPCPQQLVHVID